jgi:citrate/tricarballylate utilization protein
MMRICNACRYCESFCAVFPALERRLTFSEQDLHQLANLCHDCGECYYSCPYAPPHEFALDLPRMMAEIRRETYRKYAWPGWFRGLFRRSGLGLFLSAVAIPVLFLLLIYFFTGPSVLFSSHSVAERSFYRVVPHAVMVQVFGIVGMLVFIAFIAGLIRFWRDAGETLGSFLNLRALGVAVSDTLRLRYLDGGGVGCAYPEEVPSQARRWFHHLTFYGFLLCFAATTVAAIYHNLLGWEAPYPLFSIPVVLGSVGGVGLLIGPLGLLWLKSIRNPTLIDRAQTAMDVAFLVLLFLTSVTGFLLLVLRESSAMGTLLAVHLGIVMGLFLTLPYGKFVHGIYRFAALVRNANETRRALDIQRRKD